MKAHWVFFEYANQKTDYPNNPFSSKTFYNFDEMKEHSAKVAVKNKPKCVDYCSTYWKVTPLK
jgi:hypothetical protein